MDRTKVAVAFEVPPRGTALAVHAARLLRFHTLGCISACMLLTMIVLALVGPVLAPYDPNTKVAGPLLSPSGQHWLGTDHLGRDILSRILQGASISIRVGVMAVILNIAAGTTFGMMSGYFGGVLDLGMQRLIDMLMTIPMLLLAMIIVTALGPSVYNVVLALVIGGLPRTSRVVRSAALSIKETDYVLAATAAGASRPRILLRHILPQIVTPIIVLASVILPGAIIAESSLSFLGLGVPDPHPSWGRMLSDARRYLAVAPWIAAAPGVMIAVTVFSGNMLGDMLRELLDPRLRGRV